MTLGELAKQLESQGDQHLDLVRTSRLYRFPKGYIDWRSLSGVVAFCLANYQKPAPDLASKLNAYRTALWFVQDAPVYCVSTKLLRAFEESDVEQKSELLADLKPPLPTFMLLFPQNAIRTPEGGNLDYAIVHLSEREYPERSHGIAFGFEVPYLQHEHTRNLHWLAVDSKEVVWFSGCGLYEDGTVYQSDEQVGALCTTLTDRAFLRTMRSVVLQCLLALTYVPELCESEPTQQCALSVVPKKGHIKQVTRQPRWLGKEYNPSRESVPPRGSSSTPVRKHWRRGHWRRVVIGARADNRRKWVWIQPVEVG